MFYRISVTERGLTGIANIFRSRLSRLDDLLGAGTVPLSFRPWAWSHVASEDRVDSMRWIREGRLHLRSDTRIWVSSAYWVTWTSGACRLRSFAKMVKRRGPRADP